MVVLADDAGNKLGLIVNSIGTREQFPDLQGILFPTVIPAGGVVIKKLSEDLADHGKSPEPVFET